MASHADQTVITTGYLVVTAITDKRDCITTRHSPIYPTEAEAQAACIQHMPREVRIWEKSVSRAVIAVRTAFPAVRLGKIGETFVELAELSAAA